MQVKYRQSGWYGCGSFSLANIFDDHRFVESLPSGHGERFPDLQRKMNRYQRRFMIDTLFLTNVTLPIGNRLEWHQKGVFTLPKKGITKEFRETMCVPYMVSIARHNGNTHMIAVFHNLKDNMFYSVDSCEPDIIKYDMKTLLKKFNVVAVSVFRFWNHPEQGNFMFGSKECFSHIFTPED